MNWLRRGFVGLLALLLFGWLLSLPISITTAKLLANPEKISNLLAESGVYEKLTTALLADTQTATDTQGGGASVSLSDPIVKGAAQEVFTPEVLKSNVDSFISANHRWLKGETAQPEFKIDLTSAKQDFAVRVGEQVKTHLSSLPACTPEQEAQLQIPINPLAVTCRPAALDPAAEGARVTQEISNSAFIEKPVITPANINQNEGSQNQPYYQEHSYLPKAYQWSQRAPWILAALCLLTGLGILLVSSERRRGWRRLAIVLLLAGVLLIVGKFVADSLVRNLEDQVFTSTLSKQLENQSSNFLSQAQSELMQINLWFGIAYLVLALVIIIFLVKTRERQPKVSAFAEPSATANKQSAPHDIRLAARSNQPPHDDVVDQPNRPKPAGPPTVPASRPKKPKRPRLIQ